MLYSHNGQYPTILPHRITLSDGTTRTDVSTFTEEELADAGYVAVTAPIPTAVYPQRADWDGSAWYLRDPNAAETSAEVFRIRNLCLDSLEATDYKVLKAYEAGAPVAQNYVEYRQAWRDLYNSVNSENVWTTVLPQLAPETSEEPA